MIERVRTILILVILFSSALKAQAQIPLPEKVCVGTLQSYWVNGLAGSTYTWKVNGVVQGSTNHHIDITWSSAGVFHLEVQEHQADCQGAVQSGMVEVTDLSETLQVTITQPTCTTATGSVELTGLPAGTWSINPGNIIGNTSTYAVNGLTANSTYNFTVADAAGCVSSNISVPINAQAETNNPVIITETHVDTDNVIASGSIDLTVSGGTGPGTYLYSWSNGANSEDLNNLASGTYVVVVTDNNNCNKVILTVRIEYLDYNSDCQLFIPEAFSPNGDGVHDYFQIYCFNHYPNATIHIFDQLGNKVFEKANYGNLEFWGTFDRAWWSGRPDRGRGYSSTELVPPGTYYYVLDLGNGVVKKSFVFVSYEQGRK